MAHGNGNFVDVTLIKGLTASFTPLLLGLGGLTTLYTKVLVWGGRPPRLGNYGVNTGFEIINIAVLITMITYTYAVMNVKLFLAITPVRRTEKTELAPLGATEANPIPPHALRLPSAMATARPRVIGGSSSSDLPGPCRGQMGTDLWGIACTVRPAAPRPRGAEPWELRIGDNVNGIVNEHITEQATPVPAARSPRPALGQMITKLMKTPPTTIIDLRLWRASAVREADPETQQLIFKIQYCSRVKIMA